MSMPVTPEDFRIIGQRFASEDIVATIDRLLPIAKKDIDGLTLVEYGLAQLTELEGHRAKLTGESADRRQNREKKKGSRRTEVGSIVAAKRLVRLAADVGGRAIARRKPPAGEAPDETRRIADSFEQQLDALGGKVALDSGKVRTRLASAITILEAKELAPPPETAKARATLVARLKTALATLPGLAELKKGLQAGAREDTAELDEVDGRAYENLKALCSAGRNYHVDAGDPKRAREYNLNDLHLATRKRAAEAGPGGGGPGSTPK